jgi:Zn-finger nucleic acid-binding protein
MSATTLTAPIVPPHHCDCGSYGDKKDSSGWSCPSCREALKGIGLMIEKMINRQRAELFFDERLARDAEYRERYEREHRDEILLRHRNYNKARRLRLKAMNVAPATSFAALGRAAVLESEEQQREAA